MNNTVRQQQYNAIQWYINHNTMCQTLREIHPMRLRAMVSHIKNNNFAPCDDFHNLWKLRKKACQ